MIFEQGHLYHIYNQGNNKQPIFFRRENYLFFLQKIAKHILPFADVLAWCLMPNHFHLLVYVHTLEVSRSGSATLSRAPTKKLTLSRAPIENEFCNNLNQSIGKLLSSYTRSIQKQENITGSLFRDKTKAPCLTKAETITPSFFNSPFGTYLNVSLPEKDYPQACFDYIHNNPLKANLVKKAEDWEFSSLKDYSGLRNGKMINREKAKEYGFV